MRFIKGVIVTRIDYEEDNDYLLEKYFDLSLYKKHKNSYYLKEDILNKNIKELRTELLSFTQGLGDSLDDSDAYILNTTLDKLLSGKIFLSHDNTTYFYENFKNNPFETLFEYQYLDDKEFSFYMISIIWDVSGIQIEDVTFFNIFINNLVHHSINNKLKGAFWFSVLN